MNRLTQWLSPEARSAPEIERPHLDLSGELLTEALTGMINGAEDQGGVERYVEALKLKVQLYAEAFQGGVEGLDRRAFFALAAFMPTVRRRLMPYMDQAGFDRIRDGLGALLADAEDASTADARIAAFCACFPQDKEHRFIRDLAAEVLHHLDPERYPLMTRWVWDGKANTGVLREIWFGPDVDHMTIPVDDSYATHLMLREELSLFLTENGIYRDMPYYVDLLVAQVYAQYICAQGGTYLRTDFAAPEDPMQHTRRMLGLDGVRPDSNRTRLKAIDGESFVVEDRKLLG